MDLESAPQRSASTHVDPGHREEPNPKHVTDPTGWKNPLFRKRNRTQSDLTPEEQEKARLKHERKLEKGQHPNHVRFHPVKAVKIAGKSTSKLSSYSNVLFPAVPIAFALYYAKREWHLAIFIVSFVAMIPSANMLAFAGGEFASKLPKTIGATLEILLGAVVEIILCLILLFDKQYDVVRAALLGSMLANLLLVTGTCFLAGGIAYREQELAEFVTEVSGAALLVSAVGVILPSQFYTAIYPRPDIGEYDASVRTVHVSRVVSCGLLVAYGCFLFFQLKTHSTSYHHVIEKAEEGDADLAKERYRKKLSLLEAAFFVGVALTFVTFMAFFLVQEIPWIVENQGISDPFMGLILVPLVEKAAENLVAIDQAWDKQMDLALSHALGSTIQTALLVSPIIVIIGWIAHLNMDLNFEYFMAFSLVLAVLIVGNFVRDRKTNWLEGGFLIMVYFVIAVSAFYYPNPPKDSHKIDAGVEGGGNSVEGGSEEGTMTSSAIAEAATTAAVEHAKRMIWG